MKKNLIYLAVGALFFGACSNEKKDETPKVNTDSIRVVEIEAQYEQANSFNDSLLLLMGDIYTGLNDINAQEGLLSNMGSGDNVNRREEIQSNLAAIKERLNKNKLLVAELEKRLKESEAKNAQSAEQNSEAAKKNAQATAVLQRTIDQMKKHIADQEARIDDLSKQLAEAHETITNLTGQVEETKQQLTVETQAKEEAQAQVVATENAANTVYYVIGTNKQLKEYKVLEKRFLGATKIMQGDNINYNCFKSADKRTLTSIPTGAKKVEIKSLNDKDSYIIEGGKDDPKTIKITNPELFWQKTPYLVIETK